ncbi:uncharacterized protein DUF4191 [Motilibacter peucedani]|uniref:Uncharacterized protein DUF4191 n=1 Tax=Motilibacter peucedani TaxID=598650 RepID=A0A420XP93_9ACTN|nr:DUF4191 domain-containing protein [Motilibacter peucedani]RKS74004.1 uncharacterized protein DUF4191 [Motilibacter peucedani]
MARAMDPGPAPKKQRFATARQIVQAYSMTRKTDRWIGAWVLGTFVAVLAVFVVLGIVFDHPVYLSIVGIPFAVLSALIVFGRRAEKAAYATVEGQPGAAAAVLNQLKRGWTVQPAVAATPKQDIVHRAIGRPGIVLVGEGSPQRVGTLLAQERKKLGRVAPDAPVIDFQVGSGEGQISLKEFQRKLVKLPRILQPSQVADVERRISALSSLGMQVPKGPLPKGMRAPRQMR